MYRILTLLPIVFIQFFFNSLISQELWGITSEGGPFENGTVFKIDIPSGDHEIKYDFPYAEGRGFQKFYESVDGFVYGLASTLNGTSYGSITRYNPQNNNYEPIFEFSDSTGSYASSIIGDPITGLIYGTTYSGGYTPVSYIFRFNPSNSEFNILHTFVDTLGENPLDIVFHDNGLLYGVTKQGGSFNRGVLFNFDIFSYEYDVLFHFNDSTGGGRKGILATSDGDLYGTTNFGGDYHEGVLFRYDVSSGLYEKYVDFNDTIGKSLKGSLIEASNGKLYGTAYGGGELNGGVLFEFDKQSKTYSVLHHFDFYEGLPLWYLSELKNEELFGCTNMGGDYNCGTVFKYDILQDSLFYINEFDLNIGNLPNGLFLKCSNGKIISTTHRGGVFNSGSFLEFDISDYSMNKIYDFYGYSEYHDVVGTLINSPEGGIYGLTNLDDGIILESGSTLFSIDKEAEEHKVLDIFSGSAKSLSHYNYEYYFYPSGGSFRAYFHDSLKSTTICDLNNPIGYPTGSLVLADNNIMYGMQQDDNPNPAGLIFSFNPLNYYNEKNSGFWGSNGAYPIDNSLINIHDGFLYGLTSGGGANNDGVIFKYDPLADEITKLYDFSSSTGSYPTGDLLAINNDVCYGMTNTGGSNNLGVIYKYSLTDIEYIVIHEFDGINGANPTGSLIQASNGKLYGLTTNGGEFDKGVVFEFDLSNNTFSKILDFNGDNGSHPLETSLIEVCDIPTIVQQPENIEVIEGNTAYLAIVPSEGEITGIQWFRHNLPLDGETNDTLFIEQASILDQGYYYCEIYTICSSIRSQTVYLSFESGLDKNEMKDVANVYPNPSNGIINIELRKPQSISEVSIFDMYGKKLFNEEFQSSSEIMVNISQYEKGVYFLKLNATTIKLIKY